MIGDRPKPAGYDVAADRLLVSAWRDAAVADGWSIEATYPGEPVDAAAKLARDGFTARVFARSAERTARVYVWGPDGASLDHAVPEVYEWRAIVAAVRTCAACGATDVATSTIHFSYRSCSACAPAARAELETERWYA